MEDERPDQALQRNSLILLGGFLMIPISVLGLIFQQSFVWVICPQSLVVMFIRQWQSAYDSLGAADFPDLAVALLYYPLSGWILARAGQKGKLSRIGICFGIWHVVAIALAVAACDVRNRLWGF